jgi:hypothetical protein
MGAILHAVGVGIAVGDTRGYLHIRVVRSEH